MKEVIYKNAKSGLEPIDLQFLKESILHKTSQYWGKDTSVIKYKDDFDSSVMMLLFREELGFFVWLSNENINSEAVYTIREGNDAKSVVTVDLPENDWHLYKRNFVTPETTWKAVEEFIKSGKMRADINWEKFIPAEDEEIYD